MAVKTITPADFRQIMQNGAVRLLDVRTPAEYARVHAVGAQLVPLDTLEPSAVAARRSTASEPVYVICQSGGRAAKACERLATAGVSPVYSIAGGMAAWEAAGLPVERGTTRVISLERQVRVAAGALAFVGSLLAWLVHPVFLTIPAFIGAGLVFAGITDFCGMGMLLARMPWNQRDASCGKS